VRVLHTESRNILDLKVNGPYDNVSISHLLTFAAAAAAAHTTGEITHCVRAREREIKGRVRNFICWRQGRVCLCASARSHSPHMCAFYIAHGVILFIDI